MASGCRDNIENNSNGNLIEDTDDPEDLQIKTIDVFLKMIQPQTKASEFVVYIRSNIQYINVEDAKKMIEYLLIYQTEIIDDFNKKIYEERYMNFSNQDMEWVLDEKKVGNILDEKNKKRLSRANK